MRTQTKTLKPWRAATRLLPQLVWWRRPAPRKAFVPCGRCGFYRATDFAFARRLCLALSGTTPGSFSGTWRTTRAFALNDLRLASLTALVFLPFCSDIFLGATFGEKPLPLAAPPDLDMSEDTDGLLGRGPRTRSTPSAEESVLKHSPRTSVWFLTTRNETSSALLPEFDRAECATALEKLPEEFRKKLDGLRVILAVTAASVAAAAAAPAACARSLARTSAGDLLDRLL